MLLFLYLKRQYCWPDLKFCSNLIFFLYALYKMNLVIEMEMTFFCLSLGFDHCDLHYDYPLHTKAVYFHCSVPCTFFPQHAFRYEADRESGTAWNWPQCRLVHLRKGNSLYILCIIIGMDSTNANYFGYIPQWFWRQLEWKKACAKTCYSASFASSSFGSYCLGKFMKAKGESEKEKMCWETKDKQVRGKSRTSSGADS